MKKYIPIFIVCTLLLALFPIHTLAQTSGDYTYKLLPDGTASITKYSGAGGDVVIPDTLDGYLVTEISDYSFRNTPLTSAIIPNSVIHIDHYAFFGCVNLTSVVIPDSVIKIGSWAFGYCINLTKVAFPDSVTGIGLGAFYRSPWLENQTQEFVIVGSGVLLAYNGGQEYVNIPEGVTYICSNAFDKSKSFLKGVTIPEGVKTIEFWTFYDYSSLMSIAIPDSVTEIGREAFLHTPWLASQTQDFVIVGEGVLVEYKGRDTDVVIPDGVTYISDAFVAKKHITNVTIPDGVKAIGVLAFYGCGSLTRVTIPGSIIGIESAAFDDCRNLAEVYFLGARPAQVHEEAFFIPYLGRSVPTLYYPAELAASWAPNGETTWKSCPIKPFTEKRGDANCDNQITAADAAAILRHLVRLETLSAPGLKNALVTNTSGNTEVSATDAAKILRYLVRLEKTL